MIVELNSVGCVIDTETLNTYPMLIGGGYDNNEGVKVHIDNVNEELFQNLSDDDFGTVEYLINKRTINEKG